MDVKLAEFRVADILRRAVDAIMEVLGALYNIAGQHDLRVWVEHQARLLGAWPSPLSAWPPMVPDQWATVAGEPCMGRPDSHPTAAARTGRLEDLKGRGRGWS